jgi:diguanylate cyclase (GGDEF)-like protein/PAS domain S-box-containing protein
MRFAHGTDKSHKPELRALLKSMLENMPEVAAIHIADSMGNHIYSSLDRVPHVNIADRSHFIIHKDNSEAGLVISPPLISRTFNKWTIVLTRRLNFEDGSFAGVAVVILNLEHFQKLYRTLNLGSHGVVALYDKEFHLAARYPPNEQLMGKAVPLSVKKYIDKGEKHGVYSSISPVDGIKRQMSFRQVGDLPLIVFAGISEEDYLASWHRRIWKYSIAVVIFSLVLMSFGLRLQRAKKILLKDEERFRLMLETSPIAVRIANSAGRRVLFANQRYAELIESQPTQVIGADPKIYYSKPQEYEEVLLCLSRGKSVTNKLIELVTPGGKTKWALSSYFNLEYKNELAVLGWFYDITERKLAEEKILNLAFYDTLTQLPNRRLLDDRLKQAMAASKRSGYYGALMFLDLDNFKSLNDLHGHGAGDLLLIEVAHRISLCVRETDTVSRFGGDEFVVVLGELDSDKDRSIAQAGIVAEKIRTTLAEPYKLTIHTNGNLTATVDHHCTSSIGVVLFINHQASTKDILKWADIAMFQAKEAGRNLVRFYESKV